MFAIKNAVTYFGVMSQKVSLSTEETYILADLMKSITDKRLNRRLLCISLRHYGYRIREISIILGVSERAISGWISRFLAGGFDALLATNYHRVRNSMLNAHRSEIIAYLAAHPEANVRDVQQWLADRGQVIDHSWLYRWLHLHRKEWEAG